MTLPALGHYIIVIPISIHAPARGATQNQSKYQKEVNISIHAPARGATFLSEIYYRDGKNFNPRTREGCDLLS